MGKESVSDEQTFTLLKTHSLKKISLAEQTFL
jgi:hypothetical protein